MSSNNLFKIQA
jgi:chromosome segregation ATPase